MGEDVNSVPSDKLEEHKFLCCKNQRRYGVVPCAVRNRIWHISCLQTAHKNNYKVISNYTVILSKLYEKEELLN